MGGNVKLPTGERAEKIVIEKMNSGIFAAYKNDLYIMLNHLNNKVMVKHIVLFKLKDEASADEKLAAMNDFKKAIEALPAKIPVIRKIEVGLNINPAETWSIALYSEFDTLDDVKFYAAHPDHVAAGKLIAEVKESRACVDYEV